MEESELSELLLRLKGAIPDRRVHAIRVVDPEFVRWEDTVLVPANRTESAERLVQLDCWPNLTVLPLTIYHHNLVVSWRNEVGDDGLSAERPVVEWTHFSDERS